MVDPYIGKMLDNRYEILERIGTGGMAVVYKAKCHRLNRLVAVKILKSDLAQNEEFRRRFHAESKAVAMLSHPNIVSVYDVSQSDDVEYIVMELIDGITLKQYMEKRGRLDWRESLHFTTQIMRGLSHAHSRGIVHRDIKPQNIMVLRDGSVKVADFGIACLENSAQTLTQEALGSVHYISPEQARGDRTDARSDIYSAGVVLYEMLTNRLPFEGDSAVSVAIQHLSSIPLAPREIDPNIPEPLELICMKAMAPDRDRRYDSAEAMIADLDAFRKNPGVELDIDPKDLHPEETDEPTRLIHTGAVAAATAQHHSSRELQRESSRDYDRGYDRNYDRDYDRENPRKPAQQISSGKRTAMIVGVVVVALVAIFFLARAVFSSMEAGETYTVPRVVGYTVDEARKLPEVAGIFEITETKSVYDNSAVGTILEQDPPENMPKKSNLIINVTVSAGVKTDNMPDLTGKTAQEAKIALKNLIRDLDLKVETKDESNDDVTTNCVIRTEPEVNAPLKKGDTVTLIISTGPNKTPVTVISFLSLPIDKAKEQATAMGLKVTQKDVESGEAAGTVIDQDIPANSKAYVGDTITLSVSKGPADTQSPGNGAVVTKPATFSLPQDGRETVHMVVLVNGVSNYEGNVNCSDGSATVDVSGTGIGSVQVYYDGVLFETRQVDFNA
ncbi:Serine/threonine-protein kinase PrkC [anaerobic digester metagenome]|jgi:serine/threonine-protein kinase|uniref:Stk1 family PASTA domain-containing Ser/Thr kinase n=1 Tax=Oscillibacter ruminantium TaxID=1263547 RepID=UPI0002EF0E9D|nr:Stk1 family PASTA domain-containing Ser/Thr kinase [Oscillibacter ruminantium]